MSGVFFLDWAILSVSLFNTILLIWLGITVLLNADRFSWGIGFAGGGLLLGGVFFLSHTAILGLGMSFLSAEMDLWWQIGWVPAIFLPFSWYLVNLWYAGFFENLQTPLHRRHRPWLAFVGILISLVSGLLVFANPLPRFSQVVQLDLTATPSIGGIPVLIFIYPLYILFCMGLALDVLRRPGPSRRVMGDLARDRAKPWLMGATIVLLLVGLLVGWVMVWVVTNSQRGFYEIAMARTIARFDLIIEALIALAIILVGQGVVSYEVFTGKTLPRRGILRHWRRAVVLATGYGVLVGGGVSYPLPPVYSLLLSTILLTVFYALLSWRSFSDRERYMRDLRPFVRSQQMYDSLIDSSFDDPSTLDFSIPFYTLCEEVLGTQLAHLVALGPLAPFVGPARSYPPDISERPIALAQLAAQFKSPEIVFVAVQPEQYGGASWAIPLWSERGLIGVLLLGEKSAGGLYTQEEIEIGRATGERLIDTQGSVELGLRLMRLQRQRFAQSQVLDQRTRRVLHDEILPRLHTTMLELSASQNSSAEDPDLVAEDLIETLTDVHRQIANLLRELPAVVPPEVARLGLVAALKQVMETELAGVFDRVSWQITPSTHQKFQALPPLVGEVVYFAMREAVRNAAWHGGHPDREHPLNLMISISVADGIKIIVEDDGVGLDADLAGWNHGGQGLQLHSTMMAVIGGTLAVESERGKFTRVMIDLPEVP
jgi:signal transduction histidine kinase